MESPVIVKFHIIYDIPKFKSEVQFQGIFYNLKSGHVIKPIKCEHFSVNRLHKAFLGTLEFNNNKDNFEIWRTKIPIKIRKK